MVLCPRTLEVIYKGWALVRLRASFCRYKSRIIIAKAIRGLYFVVDEDYNSKFTPERVNAFQSLEVELQMTENA